MKVAVSACLLGSKCRYDGDSRPCEAVIAFARRHEVVPICPEQLGGLAIPHAPSEVDASSALVRVVDSNGQDRTDAFVKGAQRALEIAQKHDCHIAILKSKSPSCGCGAIYDGTFSKRLVPGYGIAARLLRENGIRVIDENAFQSCTDAVLASCAAEEPVLETGQQGMAGICRHPIDEYSQHAIENCGFIKEGIRRASDLGPTGEPRDTVCYSLAKEEYLRNTAE